MDQQNNCYLRPEPDNPGMVPTSWNMAHLPDHYSSAMYYPTSHYHGVGHSNFDQGVAVASNYYMNPSSGNPFLHGSPNHFPSTNNYGAIGVHEHNHFEEDIRGSFKRKNAEGVLHNFQHINASASSSSSAVPPSTRHPDGAATIDVLTPFMHPQFRGNGVQPIREAGAQRSVRNRLGATGLDPVQAHSHSHYMPSSNVGQPFQQSVPYGFDQQMNSSFMNYMLGSNVSEGSSDAGSGNMVQQLYHESNINRNSGSSTAVQSSPFELNQNNFNHLSQHPPQVWGQNFSHYAPVAAPRVQPNYALHGIMYPFQDRLENVVTPPAAGFRIYRPHREGLAIENSSRNFNLPFVRVLPNDEAGMLELSDIYEVQDYVDNHRDMRLDIEDMSYEELLELGEQIGNVSTGLSEENVVSQLKTRTYISSLNLEEPASIDQESDSCIICQEDYQRNEKIGRLDCGHEYHSDCLKKWLVVKNVCPVCKSGALKIT